jgi:hypothetical protein
MSDFWQTIFAVVLFALIAAVAYGHPGALDDSNCHRVQQDYKYQSGKVLKKGSYHCHGRLDGRNMIEDEKGEKKESKDKQK